MRLTCPNCGAQYEVPDGVIPPEGRDVQCSNCGDTWFQDSPESADYETAPVAQPGEPDLPETPPASASEPEPEPEAIEEPQPEADLRAEYYEDEDPFPEDEDDDEELPEQPAVEESAAPVARGLDPAISDILREEAAREAQLRSGEMPETLESQPELGLDAAADDESSRRAHQAKTRMARIKGEPVSAVDTATDAQGSRRGLLPDIDEINSTLRSNEGGTAAAPDPTAIVPPPRKSGFVRGFALVLMVAVILGLIYQKAPEIAQAVPQADPMLSAYVALVDQARLWLDTNLGNLLNTE